MLVVLIYFDNILQSVFINDDKLQYMQNLYNYFLFFLQKVTVID